MKYYEERLKSMPADMLQFEKHYQERLKIEIRKPGRLKIDDYFEKYRVIRYNYDFGDNWWFTVELEEVVDDYYLGFPMLLDGAGTAPPEDVGGIHGFDEFMEISRNPEDPEYEETMLWADSQQFEEYDPEKINKRLKSVDYKKTEWDKVALEYCIFHSKKCMLSD